MGKTPFFGPGGGVCTRELLKNRVFRGGGGPGRGGQTPQEGGSGALGGGVRPPRRGGPGRGGQPGGVWGRPGGGLGTREGGSGTPKTGLGGVGNPEKSKKM